MRRCGEVSRRGGAAEARSSRGEEQQRRGEGKGGGEEEQRSPSVCMLPWLSTRTRGASRPTCRLAWPWIDALAAAVATERLPLPSALLLAVGGIGLRWLGNGCE